MCFDDLPRGWLNRLGYKLFAANSRDNLLPNLRCFCLNNINPIIVETIDQMVAFTYQCNNEYFGISAVYASTCHVRRKSLWNSLQNLQTNNQIPWCFIGYYNAILGAHEKRRHYSPTRIPMENFQNWTNNNNLIHLPTRGANYNWKNGREGHKHTDRRLDRCICTHSWIDKCSTITCSNPIRYRSNPHPILLEYLVNHQKFTSQLKFMKMWNLHDDCKNIVANFWDTTVVGCPVLVLSKKLQILKANLKDWNKSVFGNVHNIVKQAETNLQDKQNQIQINGHTDLFVKHEKKAQCELDKVLNIEEVFWLEKSKVKWHLKGDRNTAYFNRVTIVVRGSSSSWFLLMHF